MADQRFWRERLTLLKQACEKTPKFFHINVLEMPIGSKMIQYKTITEFSGASGLLYLSHCDCACLPLKRTLAVNAKFLEEISIVSVVSSEILVYAKKKVHWPFILSSAGEHPPPHGAHYSGFPSLSW
jgi:hypothetical protein